MRVLSVILSGNLLLPALAFAEAEESTGYRGLGMMPWGWGMGEMMFMMPVMFILAIAVIFTGVFMVRRIGGEIHGYPPRPPFETPLEILKKRYARGDIDREEFELMRKDLQD